MFSVGLSSVYLVKFLNVALLAGSTSLFIIFAGRSTSVEKKRLNNTEFNGNRSGSLGATPK